MGGINDLKNTWPSCINRPLKSVNMVYRKDEEGKDKQAFIFVLQDGTAFEVEPDWKPDGRPYTNEDIIKFAASKLRQIEIDRAAGKPDKSDEVKDLLCSGVSKPDERKSMQGLLSSVDEHINKLDEAPAQQEGPVEGFFSSSKTGEGT